MRTEEGFLVMYWMGRPVHEMEKAELLKIIEHLARENEKLRGKRYVLD